MAVLFGMSRSDCHRRETETSSQHDPSKQESVKTGLDFPEAEKHNPHQTLEVWNRFSASLSSVAVLRDLPVVVVSQTGGIK
jgi:hypothetical protein